MDRPLHSLPPPSPISLVYPNGEENLSQTYCTLPDGTQHVRSVPEICGTTYCFGSSYGWLMLDNCHSIILFNPTTLEKIHMPPSPCKYASAAALNSSPSDPNCVLVVFSDRKGSLFLCKIGGDIWSEQNLRCELREEEDQVSTVAVSCNEKIYLFFQEGMAVIHDIHDTHASVKRYLFDIPEFSIANLVGRSIKYLESCGEIFMVALLWFGASKLRIQTLDVFKWDINTVSWVKVETPGDRIFLLGDKCTSVSATELGLKSNCIYFYQEEFNTIMYRYDMDDGTILNFLACSITDPDSADPFWLVLNCKQEAKKQVGELVKESYSLDEVNLGMRSMKYIPNELIDMIFTNLFLGDCVRFRLACKSWISMCPPIRSNHLLLPAHPESKHIPWLISFPKNNKGLCKFYNPFFGDAYSENLTQLGDATLRCADYGWWLMSRRETCFFFFNPFSKEIIQLPDLPEGEFGLESISFSAPPTSSDFIVFGLHCVMMYIYCKGQETWSNYFLSEPHEFIATHCTPISCGGVLYVLGRSGKLGVFDPKVTDEESRWKILPVPSLFSFSMDDDIPMARSFYVVKDNADIISVFASHQGDEILIYRYDKFNEKWSLVESLGENVLFLSNTTSMLVPAGLKGFGNRIYFSRFHVKDNVSKGNVFYSLSTKRYHCLGSQYSCENWMNTSENWHCAWFQSSK